MDAEFLIVGGGVGGGVLAGLLGKAGRRVVVLERNPGKTPIVRPEVLWPATVDILASLLPPASLPEAMVAVKGIKVIRGGSPRRSRRRPSRRRGSSPGPPIRARRDRSCWSWARSRSGTASKPSGFSKRGRGSPASGRGRRGAVASSTCGPGGPSATTARTRRSGRRAGSRWPRACSRSSSSASASTGPPRWRWTVRTSSSIPTPAVRPSSCSARCPFPKGRGAGLVAALGSG